MRQSESRALPHTIVCTAPYLPSQGSKEPVSLTSKLNATSSIAHQRHRLSESNLAFSQFAKTSTTWFLLLSAAGFCSHPKLSKPLSAPLKRSAPDTTTLTKKRRAKGELERSHTQLFARRRICRRKAQKNRSP